MEMNNKKYISDIITMEEIENWDDGSIINISAGTGTGKSTFIKNTLYNYCRRNRMKSLMLLPRKRTKNQFKEELKKANKNGYRLKIMTYQTIESHYKKHSRCMDLSEYDFIICDESHYFFGDSGFNRYTDISFNTILNARATKIYMSATGETIFKYMTDKERTLTEGKIIALLEQLPDDVKTQFYYMIKGAVLASVKRN